MLRAACRAFTGSPRSPTTIGTDKQVKRFQKSVALKPTGAVDRTTWMALLSASAQR
ncbi:MAG: hypothetical protein EB130_04710 [Actinobacteria bacterium]|nr:hypothetical protein [Actinomycetota bacterium]